MATIPTSDRPDERTPYVPEPVIDWIIGLVVAFFGLVAISAGGILTAVIDEDWIAEQVEAGTIQADGLTEAQTTAITFELGWWGGVGVAVSGIILLLAGIGYILYRRRLRRRHGESLGPDTITNAYLGAFVSVIASFIPFSPILGGAIAGYLEGSTMTAGAKTGALAGLFGAIPIAPLVLAIVIATVAADVGIIGVVIAVASMFALVYLLILAALGGLVGGWLFERGVD